MVSSNISKEIEFSFAKEKVTPKTELRLRLGGYMHRLGLHARGIHDDLYIRMLRITSSSNDVVLLQLDLLGLYKDDVQKLRKAVSSVTGIKADNVVVATTHTHSAPETVIPMWPNTLPYTQEELSDYRMWFSSVVETVHVLSEKLNETSKASLYISYTTISDICYNRAFPNEPFDDETPILLLKGDRNRVVVYAAPCHPVCNMDLGYSADYHGYVAKALQKLNIDVIPLTGPAGNVDPLRKGLDYAMSMGRTIADKMVSALNTSVGDIEGDVNIVTHYVTIPLRSADLNESKNKFERAYKEFSSLFFAERVKGVPDPKYFTLFEPLLYADQEYEVAKIGKTFDVIELQLVTIGNRFLFIAIPGEYMSESSIDLKLYLRSKGFKHVMISTYTNGYIGYLPTKKYFSFNRYEARLALWSRATQDAETIVNNTIKNIFSSKQFI